MDVAVRQKIGLPKAESIPAKAATETSRTQTA
jgi:hypothetical protein